MSRWYLFFSWAHFISCVQYKLLKKDAPESTVQVIETAEKLNAIPWVPFPVEVNPEFYPMYYLLPKTLFVKEPSKSRLLWSLRTLKHFARDVGQFAPSLFTTESSEPWHSLKREGLGLSKKQSALNLSPSFCIGGGLCSKFTELPLPILILFKIGNEINANTDFKKKISYGSTCFVTVWKSYLIKKEKHC